MIMTEDSISMSPMDDFSTEIRYAIYDCKMYFLEIGFILENIKKTFRPKRVKSLKKMTTIWEDPYM